MHVARLRVFGFRGFREATVHFPQHCVLVGPTSVGKSTIIDSLSLVLGREQMVRDLTEHDFFGGAPEPAARIRIIATVIGFRSNDPEENAAWFRERRAVEQWWSKAGRVLSPERTTACTELAVEIGFAARFNHDTLEVERLRYFHHDDSILDPFIDEGPDLVPNNLAASVGYFVVPAARNRDRLLSFGSEIFRKLVTSHDALPASELIEERDRLRNPTAKLEESPRLQQVVEAINDEFGRLLPNTPKFELRITATDSESLLASVYPHFRYGSDVALPAHRHGSGLISLQTLIVLLEFGRARKSRGDSFILGIEEPELHLAPGFQRRVVHRARAAADQSITTTHSPRVAAFFDPSEIIIIEKSGGVASADTLLLSPLAHDASNPQRVLFTDGRTHLLEALLHDTVLVPEGRSDYELLRVLVDSLETSAHGMAQDSVVKFGASIGVIPTPDAQIATAVTALRRVRAAVTALVDGDPAGDNYVDQLVRLSLPPAVVVQWEKNTTIEDKIGALLHSLPAAKFEALTESLPEDIRDEVVNVPALVGLLKTKNDRRQGVVGLKMNLLVYEAIARAISGDDATAAAAASLLGHLFDGIMGLESDLVTLDSRSTSQTKVLRWVS